MNEVAPEGKMFVCLACGKMSRDRYGDRALSPLWDESCMLNSALVDESDLIIEDGRVVQIKEKGVSKP